MPRKKMEEVELDVVDTAQEADEETPVIVI